MTSEYSPGVKHGASSNKPLLFDPNMALSNNNGGMLPEFQKIEPFQKCDSSCLFCKGPGKDECTACWAGKSLNESRNYSKDKDPFPYGICDNECNVSKYKQTTVEPLVDKYSPEGFWNINMGWICRNCHDSCYDCTGPLQTQCRECRYPDSVLQLLSSRVLSSEN